MAQPILIDGQEYKTEDGRAVYGFYPDSIERKAIDREQGIYEMMVSTEAEDRDGDVMHADGAKLENFRKNPVVLYAHDYRDLPVAKSLEETIEPNQGLRVRFQFPEQGISERANTVHQMWAATFLNAGSIGFIPLKKEPRGYTDPNGNFRHTGWDILEWELLEYSIVPVPANQEALRLAMKMAGIEEKPYPNEHACRLRNPADFQPDTFKRTSRTHEGKKYSVIMGRLKGETAMTEQAYRYAKETWTAAQASSHCKAHDGRFEAASGERDISATADDQPPIDVDITADIEPTDELTDDELNRIAEALFPIINDLEEVLTNE